MGINRDEHERFREAEMACRAMYPDCGCASMMMTADDGTTGAFPLVHCSSGTCATTFTAP